MAAGRVYPINSSRTSPPTTTPSATTSTEKLGVLLPQQSGSRHEASSNDGAIEELVQELGLADVDEADGDCLADEVDGDGWSDSMMMSSPALSTARLDEDDNDGGGAGGGGDGARGGAGADGGVVTVQPMQNATVDVEKMRVAAAGKATEATTKTTRTVSAASPDVSPRTEPPSLEAARKRQKEAGEAFLSDWSAAPAFAVPNTVRLSRVRPRKGGVSMACEDVCTSQVGGVVECGLGCASRVGSAIPFLGGLVSLVCSWRSISDTFCNVGSVLAGLALGDKRGPDDLFLVEEHLSQEHEEADDASFSPSASSVLFVAKQHRSLLGMAKYCGDVRGEMDVYYRRQASDGGGSGGGDGGTQLATVRHKTSYGVHRFCAVDFLVRLLDSENGQPGPVVARVPASRPCPRPTDLLCVIPRQFHDLVTIPCRAYLACVTLCDGDGRVLGVVPPCGNGVPLPSLAMHQRDSFGRRVFLLHPRPLHSLAKTCHPAPQVVTYDDYTADNQSNSSAAAATMLKAVISTVRLTPTRTDRAFSLDVHAAPVSTACIQALRCGIQAAVPAPVSLQDAAFAPAVNASALPYLRTADSIHIQFPPHFTHAQRLAVLIFLAQHFPLPASTLCTCCGQCSPILT